MNEIDKLYENAGIKLGSCIYAEYGYEGEEGPWYFCTKENKECWTYPTGNADCVEKAYPPFNAEKQLELMKWLAIRCDLSISKFSEWEFIHFDGNEPVQVSTNEFDRSLAQVINERWQDLTEEEKEQIKEILK